MSSQFKVFFTLFFCLTSIKWLIVWKYIHNKSLNINIGTAIKNQEILKFVPDHLKNKKMCKYAVKKLPYLLLYVPDRYNTQHMCDKASLENVGTLRSVPCCYKNEEMCIKAVDSNPYASEFVPECYRTKETCDKAVDIYPPTTKFVDCMTSEMCDKAVNRCFLYLILFLIGIKLKKCVTELFLQILFNSILS